MQRNQKVTVEVGGVRKAGVVTEIIDRTAPKEEYYFEDGVLVHQKRTSRKYRVDVHGRGNSFIFFRHEIN